MIWDGTFSLLDESGKLGFRSVRADDILYFSVSRSQVVAHTMSDVFITGWYSLDKLWKALRQSDSRFFRTDRLFIVNMSKIRKLDREWGKVYFTDDPDAQAKHGYVAKLKISEVEKHIASQA